MKAQTSVGYHFNSTLVVVAVAVAAAVVASAAVVAAAAVVLVRVGVKYS